MTSGGLRERLRGGGSGARTLILGPGATSVLADPGGLVAALRRAAAELVAAQRSIVEAGADLIIAPTAHTTAPALHVSGQAYRAAALTAAAVDLSRDGAYAAGRNAWVLGEVEAMAPTKARAEARTHVERLATSAVDGVLVRSRDHDAMIEVARVVQSHGLPAIVEVDPSGVEPIVASGVAPGSALVVRGSDVLEIRRALGRARTIPWDFPLGVRLVAPHERDRVQVFVAEAWEHLAGEALALVGVDDGAALPALRAIVDLASAAPTARARSAESR